MTRLILLLAVVTFAVPSVAVEATVEHTESSVIELPIDRYDRDHWSFQPIVRPELPSVTFADWPRQAIDHFVLAPWEESHDSPPTLASRGVLIRRLKFDLLGLPPTPDEVLAFERDTRDDAYERLVDSMLADPAYGERWAQHWLDLARFAETDGFEHDLVRENAWEYRQWVIDALNQDLPYDQFVRSQLAGDLATDPRDSIATMFCLAGPDMPDINEQDLRRHDKMNELTSTVGSVLLGLQMHCCQCHDHKYDPLSQADFFRLRGVFESSVPAMARSKPVLTLTAQKKSISPYMYYRGELSNPGPAVEPRPPRIADLSGSLESFDQVDPRLALSDWLFDDANPLTARVIANRVWQFHFGEPLCENPSDFGVIAGGPTHPELLDWLASDLRLGGWSLKGMHRTIVTSSTYQMAQRSESFPRRRLEGEVIRDSLLAISGQLNQDYGGPSVRPPLPPELVETLLPGQWKTSPREADHARRSVYVFARRNLRYPIFDVFDRPDAGASCARRNRSTTAIQSLQMLNSELTIDAADGLCNRLLKRGLTHDELVQSLFRTVFARSPSTEEAETVRQVLNDPTSTLRENLRVVCVAVLNSSEFIYLD